MGNEKNVLFSCVIPVYNEKDCLYENVHNLIKKFEELNIDFEIVVSDDGSTDSTPDIAELLLAGDSRVKYVRSDLNTGRGEAVSRGFRECSGQILAFIDIDLATSLDSLPTLIDIIKNGADVATGSRWLKQSIVKRSAYRRLISFVYNLIVRLLFNSKIKDHQCGFKAFRREKALQLLNEMGERTDRLWAWDTEILIRAQKKGLKIVEFPVVWYQGKHSKFRVLYDVPKIVIYLLKLRRAL